MHGTLPFPYVYKPTRRGPPRDFTQDQSCTPPSWNGLGMERWERSGQASSETAVGPWVTVLLLLPQVIVR